MKYFIQFEGKEKVWVKLIIILQIAITILLIALLLREPYLYITDKQVNRIIEYGRGIQHKAN